MTDDLTARCREVLDGVEHDADCEGAPHRMFGTPCDCRRSILCTCSRLERQAACMARAIERLAEKCAFADLGQEQTNANLPEYRRLNIAAALAAAQEGSSG